MRKITLTLALVAIFSSGCSRYRVFYGEQGCLNQVVINYAAARVIAAPTKADVCRGTTIRIITVPQDRAVAIAPKPGNPAWLAGRSAGPDFSLMVPMEETIGATREYSVEVDGLPTLDPTFRVIQ